MMSTALLPRDANIAYNATNSAAADKDASAFAPDAIQLIEKMLIALEVPHLTFVSGCVLLESPVRW